jgi:hypothetical protein
MPVSAPELANAYIEGASKPAQEVWTDSATSKYPTANAQEMLFADLGDSGPLVEWADGSETPSTALAQYTKNVTVTDYANKIPFGLSSYRSNDALCLGKARIEGTKLNRKLSEKIVTHVNGNFTSFDGVALYATTHVIGNQAAQKNLLTASEIPSANVNTVAAPTVLEAKNIILETIEVMRAFKNEHGVAANPGLSDFTIVCNDAIQGRAFKAALTAETLVDGSTNELAVEIKTGALRIKVFVDTSLSGSNYVWFFSAEEGNRAILLGNDEPEDMSILDEKSEHARKYKSVLFNQLVRLAIGNGRWYLTARVTLS